ncbi:MAG: outer membrane beta-barrel protein [Bryobacteraceae bacterium]
MRRVAVIALLVAASAFGQRAVDVKGSIGITVFSEDNEHHFLTGAAARFYVTRRLSIEPEFQYLYLSSQHYDLGFIPNVAFDFGGERVVPYVAGGVGLMYTRHDFGHFASGETDPFVTLGGGVKVYVTENWFVTPDVRFGFVPHWRFSASIGYTWRR